MDFENANHVPILLAEDDERHVGVLVKPAQIEVLMKLVEDTRDTWAVARCS